MSEQSQDSSDIASIVVEPFDEDAEMQARIWNGFLREVKGIDQSDDSQDILNKQRPSGRRTVGVKQIMDSF